MAAGRFNGGLALVPDGGPNHKHRFQKGNTYGAKANRKTVTRAPEFRAKCRVVSEEAINQLAVYVAKGQIGPRGLIEIVRVLAPLGGYVAGHQLASAESDRWRVILAVLDAKTVDPAKRDEILRTLMQRNDDALGEPENNGETDE